MLFLDTYMWNQAMYSITLTCQRGLYLSLGVIFASLRKQVCDRTLGFVMWLQGISQLKTDRLVHVNFSFHKSFKHTTAELISHIID